MRAKQAKQSGWRVSPAFIGTALGFLLWLGALALPAVDCPPFEQTADGRWIANGAWAFVMSIVPLYWFAAYPLLGLPFNLALLFAIVANSRGKTDGPSSAALLVVAAVAIWGVPWLIEYGDAHALIGMRVWCASLTPVAVGFVIEAARRRESVA